MSDFVLTGGFAQCFVCGKTFKKEQGYRCSDGPDLVCSGTCAIKNRDTVKEKYDPFHDPVKKPKHYVSHKSGIECIKITEQMNFCLGNAMKYIWRADLKNGSEDLKKAIWYLEREITRRVLTGENK